MERIYLRGGPLATARGTRAKRIAEGHVKSTHYEFTYIVTSPSIAPIVRMQLLADLEGGGGGRVGQQEVALTYLYGYTTRFRHNQSLLR